MIDRKKVLAKTNGKCAYCGCELNKFQVDHIIPKRNFKGEGVNDISNLLASCASCNNYKNTHSVEQFRIELGELVRRLNDTNTIYRIAKRYGHIEENVKPIVFYFETLKTNVK